MTIAEQQVGFDGRTVVAFESRRAAEMARLIERHGGRPLVAPSVREVPRTDDPAVDAFGEALLRGQVDAVVFMTGVGTRLLLEALAARWLREAVLAALARTTVVARGPKPAAALREWGVSVTIGVPEPSTWHEVLEALEAEPRGVDLSGARVAVQEPGEPNEPFLQALADRGAQVLRLPVYEWALPEDTGPLREALQRVINGDARLLLFTNAVQVDHLFQLAAETGQEAPLRAALPRAVVASIGPNCSEALRERDVPVDLEPDHPRMEDLVQEAAARGPVILAGSDNGISDFGFRISDLGESGPEQSEIRNPKSEILSPPWQNSRFMRACRLEPVDATPVWLMRQAGRYMKEYRELRGRVSFLDLCKNPQLVSEVTVTAQERIGADAAILFADILLIVEPLGLHLEYTKGEGPVIEPCVRTGADVDRLQEVDARESLAYVFDAVRQTRADLNPGIPLIGFSGAPFTLASYLIEGGASRNYEHTKALMYRDPGAWHALMGRIARGLVGYLNGQIAAGSQAVQLFDSWVGALGPSDYREFVLPHVKAVIDGVLPGTPVIHFGTGTAALLEAMREAGGHVIGLDWRVELDEAWTRLGHEVGVMGNLDSIVLFSEPAYIRQRAKRILDQAAGRPGHIFNLGHGILPQTPVDHVIGLIDAVHELSAR